MNKWCVFEHVCMKPTRNVSSHFLIKYKREGGEKKPKQLLLIRVWGFSWSLLSFSHRRGDLCPCYHNNKLMTQQTQPRSVGRVTLNNMSWTGRALCVPRCLYNPETQLMCDISVRQRFEMLMLARVWTHRMLYLCIYLGEEACTICFVLFRAWF